MAAAGDGGGEGEDLGRDIDLGEDAGRPGDGRPRGQKALAEEGHEEHARQQIEHVGLGAGGPEATLAKDLAEDHPHDRGGEDRVEQRPPNPQARALVPDGQLAIDQQANQPAMAPQVLEFGDQGTRGAARSRRREEASERIREARYDRLAMARSKWLDPRRIAHGLSWRIQQQLARFRTPPPPIGGPPQGDQFRQAVLAHYGVDDTSSLPPTEQMWADFTLTAR